MEWHPKNGSHPDDERIYPYFYPHFVTPVYSPSSVNYSIEIIRLLAVVLITFTHTRHNLESGPAYVLLEEVPKYGTLILSIISGYLFWSKSRLEPGLFEKKVKSLVVPYLLANGLVLIMVTLVYLLLGYNYLNRLSFDFSLITEGLFSLNGPPINPPTYFVRDIFLIFVLMDVVFKRRWWLLLIFIPYALFGKVLLRYDILGLFVLGMLLAYRQPKTGKYTYSLLFAGLTLAALVWLPGYSKYPVAAFLFCFLLTLPLRFKKIGGFTYLLHLYHSPVMVMTYPLLAKWVPNTLLNVFLQITVAVLFAWLVYQWSERWKPLKILSGGR